MDVRNKIIVRNTVLNFFGLVVPLAVGFVTIPMVVRALGNDRFGILALVWVVFGYFGLFDLGLGRTTTRYIADALGRNESGKLAGTLWTTVYLQTGIGLLAAILSYLAAPLIVRRVLNIPEGFVGETILTIRLVGLSLPVMFISSSFRGVLEAAQRFDLVNAVKVPVNILFYVLPLAGVALGFGLPGIVVLLVASRAAALVVWGALSLRVMPALRTRPVLHGKLVRPLFSFSGWLGLSSILYAVTSSMDRLVISRALERVLEAAKLLAGDPDILFVIVGEGLKKEALRKKAASLGLRNMAFLPFQPYRDLPGLLASADVLLVPLDKDKSQLSVPSKLYTFMAAGRPILGLAEPDSEVAILLCEKECGLAVPPDGAAAVAEAVRTLERSPEKRRLLGGNAREYVVRQFAKDKILGSYDKLLRSMVS